MRSTVTIIACLALTGCGSFPLGTVYPEKGQTQRELDTDLLFCRDWAKNETNTSTRIAGSFLAGLTIIGTPIAIQSAHDRQRELFAQCMAQRGYRVVAPT
jgi:hypothetical protein